MNRNIVANEFDDVDILDLLLSYGGDINFQTKLVTLIKYLCLKNLVNT